MDNPTKEGIILPEKKKLAVNLLCNSGDFQRPKEKVEIKASKCFIFHITELFDSMKESSDQIWHNWDPCLSLVSYEKWWEAKTSMWSLRTVDSKLLKIFECSLIYFYSLHFLGSWFEWMNL